MMKWSLKCPGELTYSLDQIWNLRSSCHLLLSFLSEEDLQDLQVKRIFSAFDAHKALESGIAFQQEWDTSLLSHKKALIPIENKVAKKLQTFLSSLQSQPSQLVREFQKFGDILGYENLSRQLESEKEVLLSHILSKLKLLKAAHQERIHQARNSFEDYQKQATVANITWTRQNLAKIHDYDTLISKIAKENIDYKKLSEESKELLNSYERELFEDWIQSTDTEELRELLDTHSAVHLLRFKFENGKLCTNYSDRLISLQRETRQLQSMGFSVPAHIRKAMELAQKHYRHNIVLKQVAHFYNTIDRQMLPYHQPMLLNLALQFEKLVKDSEALYKKASGNPQELEKYISLLQVTTDKLTSENRHLSKLHETIVEHVKTLMNVDLVKNQNRWKDIIALIRNIAYSVQERGISLESTLSWRNHIDHQIYKAFEFQYKLGLESLHEVLPEIKVDLVFKNQKLQYRPSYEEVRAKYYREIKKIVNLPSGFKTLGESDVFTRAIESNVFSMSLVYKRAEQLFQNVSKTLDAFKEWVVLGMVDLEKFVQENVKDVPDWEYNFKSLKVRGKYAEQIPSVIKVDCITVSTSSLKTTVDDHLQTLFDCLVNSLRKSIIDQYAVLDVFINKATTVLSIKPESMEDVTLASQKHKELSIEKLSLMPIFESSETKNKLLRTVSGTGIDGSQILAKWSKVELILESHELMMKEQLDVLRNAFEGRLSSFMNEMDKFEARWTHLKPKTSDMNQIGDALSAVTFLNEQRKEFSDLEAIADSLAADADLFGLSAPALNKRDTLLADINQTQEMWGICETFLGEVHVMAQEDWISFSAKNFLFEDFVAKWTNLLPKRPVDAITVHIKKELDSYQKFAPVLKYLKGDVWTPEHWSEFFHTFGKDRNLSLAKLTFGQLLDLKVDMIQRADKIRDLHARAQGEVTIREALQELDIWGASASFSLTPYIKVHGNSMTIIKEWKDLLAQIGDNQSLIQSLKDSSFYKRFLDRSSVWEQRFINLNDYLKQLNSIQRKWVYLEPLFSCGSLPDEHARFTKIDSDFTSIMDHISRDPLVLAFLDYPNVKSVLVTLHDQLERCQKALMEFLEKKRDHFARFYFIGDEDLLEILGQAKNPLVIQSHLKKLFAGVHSVQFDRDVKNIVAMCSIHGEVVPLKSPVQLSENVEIWLEEFSKEMKGSLLALLIKSVDTMDLFAVPQQIAGLVENIHFTRQVESIIERRGEFTALEQSLQSQLSKYSTFRGSAIEDKNARTVTELKIKSLMLDTLHNISIVKELKAAKATSVSDWVWRKQLRFYLNSGTNCVVRMNDAEFNYTFEYQGNYSNLAHTPLNDKCYLTLTQAMGAGFGGNPLGPAGTGIFILFSIDRIVIHSVKFR